MSLSELTAKRLVIVTGKGGVGKTTLSLALALHASSSDRKILIAQTSPGEVERILGRPAVGYRETRLLSDLWAIGLDPHDSFHEYVVQQIRFEGLYRTVFKNRLVRNFIEGTPGLADLMTIGKVFALVDRYDLVIVDAPSSGHCRALLEIPFIVSSAVRVGPLQTQASRIGELLRDRKKTAIALATLPEEMPVAETFELLDVIEKKLGLAVGGIFLNQFFPALFTRAERKKLRPFASVPLDLAAAQADHSAYYRKKFREERNDLPLLSIPFIPSRTFGLTEIQRIVREIAP